MDVHFILPQFNDAFNFDYFFENISINKKQLHLNILLIY